LGLFRAMDSPQWYECLNDPGGARVSLPPSIKRPVSGVEVGRRPVSGEGGEYRPSGVDSGIVLR
jgi:hypothetical protein